MSKIKLPAKTPRIDMTPMVDLFALLLTFFMLTATIRPQEAAPVDTPYSVSEKNSPINNMMTVIIAKDNRVFFNVDNGPDTILKFRPKILTEIGKRYGLEFTNKELRKFEKSGTSFGVPIQQMKAFLEAENQTERDQYQTGIPIDSTDNQLAMWILCTRQINPAVQACIKGDAAVEYPILREVLDILQDKNVNRFNLITNLEGITIEEEEITE